MVATMAGVFIYTAGAGSAVHPPTCSIAGIFMVGALGMLSSSPAPSLRLFQRAQTVYVSALDKKGYAVTDLQASEFEAKAGGKRLEIVSATPAQAPLRIALLIADAGTGGFQQGVSSFMHKLLGRAQFALVSVILQPD